jgi:hypothetical protein
VVDCAAPCEPHPRRYPVSNRALAAWDDLSAWLTGYSGYVRAKTRGDLRQFNSIKDVMCMMMIDAIELRFPGVDVFDLLYTRVRLDQHLPLTAEEISTVDDFDHLYNSPEFWARVAQWKDALPAKDNVTELWIPRRRVI